MKTPLLVGADRAVLEAYDKTGELVGFSRLAPPPDGADGGARFAGHLPVPAGGYLVLDDDPPADATASTWGRGGQPAIPQPAPAVAIALASIAVHAEEFFSPDGDDADRVAIVGALETPGLRGYLAALDERSLLPVRR